MACQTKMVFITSDEDLIRQISSNKSTNTHIIDLDDHEQVSLAVNDYNILDFDLAEFNSTDHQPKKAMDSVCKICGDRAIGFNYDVLSCASCKAFFRRNAYQSPEELKCITGKGECLVAHGINRKCHRCRLNRCFAMGMRKDFIVKKQEKLKRKKSKPSSNSTALPQTLDGLVDLDREHESNNEMDDVEDWLIMQRIQSSFISTMQDDDAHKFCINAPDRDTAVMSLLESADQTALRFINFFRQIDEFEGLDADDRFILMKYNIFPVFPLHKCYNYKPEDHYLSHEDNEETRRFRQFCRLFDETYDLRDTVIQLVTSLVKLTKQDPIILSSILIIIVFSQGLLMNEDEPALKDSLAVNRVQSHYTRILWNHLVNKLGEQQTWRYFTQLLSVIFQLQSASNIFRNFLRNHHIVRDSVNQLTSLLQSFLSIS